MRGYRHPFVWLIVLVSLVALAALACGAKEEATAVPSPTRAAPSPTVAPTPTTGIPGTPTTAVATSTAILFVPPVGIVQVMVTDAPPQGVTAIVITASKIEAHRADAAEEAGWDVLIEQPVTFDLVAVTGIEQLLGSQALAPGRYTQVRLSIDKTVVTYQGQEKVAEVPSDKVRVVGGFDVVQGEVTVLTLDFDADKSVVITGQGNAMLKPTLKLLVRKGGPPPATPTPTATVAAPTATPTATPTAIPATPTATATAVPPTPTATASGPSASVNIAGFAFAPASLTVAVGTTVTWTNQDTSPHTATADGGAFGSPTLSQGQSYSFTFTAAGTYAYHCAIHTSMTATVVVQ